MQLYIRTLFDEVTCILNHPLWIGAQAPDVGAMTVFLYAFHERISLMDAYEAVPAHVCTQLITVRVACTGDPPDSMPQFQANRFVVRPKNNAWNANRGGSLLDFLKISPTVSRLRVDEYETLLTDNRIGKQRLVGIGVVSPNARPAIRVSR
ncbi:MAG: hypothetical protein R3E93_05500 [Thiothrix sp.]